MAYSRPKEKSSETWTRACEELMTYQMVKGQPLYTVNVRAAARVRKGRPSKPETSFMMVEIGQVEEVAVEGSQRCPGSNLIRLRTSYIAVYVQARTGRPPKREPEMQREPL